MAATVTFDTPSDLNLFSLNGQAGTLFTYNSTAGTNNTGGIVSNSTFQDRDAAVLLQGFSNSVGGTLTAQIDYRMHFQDTGPNVRLGFLTSTGGTFNFDVNEQVWAETYGAGDPNTVAYGADGNWTALNNVSMTEGNWFRLRLNLLKTNSTDYNATISLYDLGGSGTAAPTLLDMENLTFSAPLLAAASQVYAGFFVHQSSDVVDNFTATPEPSSAILFIAAAALCLSGGNRRRTIKVLPSPGPTHPL